MNTNGRARFILLTLTFLLLNALILSHRLASKADAQIQCRQPPKQPFGIIESWTPSASVSVTIDTFWSGTLKDAIELAFQKWQSNGVINCSHVTFNSFNNTPVPEGIKDGTAFPPQFSVYVFPAPTRVIRRT